MEQSFIQISLLSCLALALVTALPISADDKVKAADGSGVFGYKGTHQLPGGKWVMHDPDRPLPPIVKVGPACPPVPAPSDAVVLFDGKDLSAWKPTPTWKLEYGQIVAEEGKLVSKASLRRCASPGRMVPAGQL